MRRINTSLLIVFFLLSFSCLTKAQNFNGGFSLGFNASQIDGDTLGGYHKAGLVFGPYVYRNFTNKISGKFEIRYSGKGSSTPADYSYARRYKLHYIDFPLTLGYKFKPVLTGEFGLTPGFLFKSTYYEYTWYDFNEPNKLDLEYSVGIDWGLFEHISLNARFSYSLISVLNSNRSNLHFNTGTWFSYVGSWYNNVLTFSIYYNFLGNKYN